MQKLTDKDLHKLLREDVSGTKLITDASGMSVLVRKSDKKGTDNSIFFKIRWWKNDTQRSWTTIGKYPEMQLSEARLKYSLLLDRVHAGEDLNAKEIKHIEDAKPHETTFGDIWVRWRKAADASVAETTSKKFISAWRSHLCLLKDVGLSKITAQYVMDFFKPYYEDKNYPTISRLAQMIRMCLDYAVFLNEIPFNPITNIAKFLPKVKTQHYASFSYETLEQDMTKLFEDLKDEPQINQAVIHFTFYTLLRSLEVRSLTLAQLKDDHAYVKTKTLTAFKVPFTTQAQKLLEYLKKHHRFVMSPYVFEGRVGGIVSDGTIRNMLDKHGYKDKLTIHGIRACGRQYLQTIPDIKESIAELCLSHVVGTQTEQAYNRSDYFEERMKAMQTWCDFVEHCIGTNGDFYLKQEKL